MMRELLRQVQIVDTEAEKNKWGVFGIFLQVPAKVT